MRRDNQQKAKVQCADRVPVSRDRLERALFMAAWLVLKDGPHYVVFMRRHEEELKKSTEALRELEHAKGVIRKLSKRPFLKKIVEANKTNSRNWSAAAFKLNNP